MGYGRRQRINSGTKDTKVESDEENRRKRQITRPRERTAKKRARCQGQFVEVRERGKACKTIY